MRAKKIEVLNQVLNRLLNRPNELPNLPSKPIEREKPARKGAENEFLAGKKLDPFFSWCLCKMKHS